MGVDDRSPPPDGPFPAEPPTQWPAVVPSSPGAAVAPDRSAGRASPLTDALPLLALAAVFALIITLGLGWALGRENRQVVRVPPTEDTTPEATTAPPSSTSSSTTTTPVARPLSSTFASLVAFVERTRGHRFVTAPSIGAVSDQDFAQRAARLLTSRSDGLTNAAARYTALGIMRDADWETPLGAMLVTQPALLDRTADRVIVRTADEERDDAYVRTEVVRQLARLLDVQLFPRVVTATAVPTPIDIGEEATFARTALAAGSAERVAEHYRETFDVAAQLAYRARQDAVAQTLASVANRGLLTVADGPARLATPIVERLVTTGGVAALDAAFTTPPTTSAALFAGDLTPGPVLVTVGAPAANGPVLAQGTLGAADLESTVSETRTAGSAAVGALWRGGRYVIWRSPNRQPCIRFRVVGATDATTTAMLAPLEEWVTQSAGQVALVHDATGRLVVEASRCAG